MAAQLLDRHKSASQNREQKTRTAHKIGKIRAPGHPKRKPTRESQIPKNAESHQPMRTQSHARPKVDSPQMWLVQENSNTSNLYIMDAEMQIDQECLTIALNKDAMAYNVYEEKINIWNSQMNTEKLETKLQEK